MKKFRRRKYLINKPLQFIYSGITIYLLLIGIIVVGIATYYITLDTILSQLEAQGGLLQAYEIVRSINALIAKRVGILLLTVMVFAFVLAVYYLHRIAGPVYRIEKTLNDMAEGQEVRPVVLRKKDFFKSLAETLNKVIEGQKGSKRQ
ncbi:MAG: methyl-accepting chemotaxis protein [Candidatus Omnitrophica bacterium]|nr:methyl-accepting chemotaxis protein [Candidatus Omnitrophota bacterium]